MASQTFAAQVVILALGEAGISIKELQALLRKQIRKGDKRAEHIVSSFNRFNLSEKKLQELLPYLRPAVKALVRDGTISFDEVTKPFHYILDPESEPKDSVSYLNMGRITAEWTKNNALPHIMPACHGMWRIFRISTPSRGHQLQPNFFESDFEVSRALLIVTHLDEVKEKGFSPQFSLYQRGTHPTAREQEKRINGHLLPVGNRLYLMGQSSGTFGSAYISIVMWLLDVDLAQGVRDGLGLLTNSNAEQIAAPLVCRRVPGSEVYLTKSDFNDLRNAELAKIGVMTLSEHGTDLDTADIDQLRRVNKRAVLRLA